MAILEPLGRPRGRVEIPYRPPGGAMGSSVGFKRHQARFVQFDSPDFGCFGFLGDSGRVLEVSQRRFGNGSLGKLIFEGCPLQNLYFCSSKAPPKSMQNHSIGCHR